MNFNPVVPIEVTLYRPKHCANLRHPIAMFCATGNCLLRTAAHPRTDPDGTASVETAPIWSASSQLTRPAAATLASTAVLEGSGALVIADRMNLEHHSENNGSANHRFSPRHQQRISSPGCMSWLVPIATAMLPQLLPSGDQLRLLVYQVRRFVRRFGCRHPDSPAISGYVQFPPPPLWQLLTDAIVTTTLVKHEGCVVSWGAHTRAARCPVVN